MNKLLTFPDSQGMVLSIRAKALLFHDPRSIELLEQVERIARSDATSLIIGQTGTGKELVARHIHDLSGREGPFIAVNCGAFSESLIDAELFGHETGAFTGASQARAGWFETANGGTLFLDEIGDLSLALQVKLLRVLQERQVVRLGSRRPIALDVRLIAATNVDLHKAIEADRFRSDLYYRLSVAVINLPPLCDRPGDILPLANHFIVTYGDKLKLKNITLSADAKDALQSYDWPGNIRELENVIHYALIVCHDDVIQGDDLRLVGAMHRKNHQSHDTASKRNEISSQADANKVNVAETIHSAKQRLEKLIGELIDNDEQNLFDSIEETVIRTAFTWCNKNQVHTAKILGISRNILRTHLKRFSLIGLDTNLAPDTSNSIVLPINESISPTQ
ncbi:sigma-54 interaction domain-containing protein [Ampullimonas aquatilis]|uniref:sigma-54 interaction domain-containing protein n=1 Tax=Ampullimonas aquatilis TaxID=1341549 RepID=UPI003C791BB6